MKKLLVLAGVIMLVGCSPQDKVIWTKYECNNDKVFLARKDNSGYAHAFIYDEKIDKIQVSQRTVNGSSIDLWSFVSAEDLSATGEIQFWNNFKNSKISAYEKDSEPKKVRWSFTCKDVGQVDLSN